MTAYSRITNFPENLQEMATPELDALSKVWLERKSEMEQNEKYIEFIRKLKREWAIETGIIERLYSWDRGITEVLIEQGIEAAVIARGGGLHRDEAEQIKNLIGDQHSIVDGLFAFIKGPEPLSEHYIRSMHAQFTANQECVFGETADGRPTKTLLIRGKYKNQPNNPRRPGGELHVYCPPEIVEEEMERLVQWYRQAPDDAPPEVLSAWLHHRFTYIHPFQDGNGRVARALASLVFLKAGLFPLVIRERDHEEYICALGEADAGDLAPLAALFARRQRDSILRAIGIEQQVRREGDPEQIMEAAFRLLRGKSAALAETQREVYPIAERLLDVSVLRMSEIQGELGSELAEIDSGYSASVDSEKMDAERSYYYWGQIVQIAKEFDYYANPEGKKAWGSLKIRTEGAFELVVSLHSYGRQFNGIMVASAFSAQRVFLEGGGTEPINTAPAMTDLFQFNYAERRESIERRFKDWLESAIAIALGEWYRTLDA